jgi:hypothetical protein
VTARVWLLLVWVLVGTAVLVVHAVVLWQVIRARQVEPRWRWLALIPPLAPVLAWVDGRRVAPIAWIVMVVVYVTLRLFEGRV